MTAIHIRIKPFIASILAAATLWACSSDTPEPLPEPAEAYLRVKSISPDNIGAEGGDVTVCVESNNKLSGKAEESWATLKSSELTGDIATFIFSIASNEGAARSTRITFTSGKLTAEATVHQDAAPAQPVTPPSIKEASSSVEMAEYLSLGWNLGNQFDAYNNGVASETAWGNPRATQQLFDKLSQAGFKAVRIPVTWLGQFGNAPAYTINAEWLDRIAEVIGYAEKAGLYAIINIHHDGANSSNWLNIKDAATNASKNAEIKKEIAAIWTQIAKRFADKGSFLIFEAFNEIHDGSWGWGSNRTDGGKQYAVLNEWNQTFVDAVRSAGGNNATRFLGIPGYCTNPSLTISHLVLPHDNANDRLLVAVHFYDPNEFAIEAKYTEWGHTGDTSKKANWGDEKNVRDTFDSLAEKYIKQSIGVYVGEFGATTRATARDESFRLYYLEYVCKAASDRKLAMFVWDNGSTSTGREAFGLFNHGTGDYIGSKSEAAVATMTKAYFTTDGSYTLDAVYANAPR